MLLFSVGFGLSQPRGLEETQPQICCVVFGVLLWQQQVVECGQGSAQLHGKNVQTWGHHLGGTKKKAEIATLKTMRFLNTMLPAARFSRACSRVSRKEKGGFCGGDSEA